MPWSSSTAGSPRRLLRGAVFLGLVLLASAGSAAGQGLPPLDSRLTVDPAVSVGRLPNGLTYYVRRNSRPEHRVELRLVVRAGSVYEANDQRGLAHMLEHMAFNGTAHFKPGELVSYFETAGARFGPHVNAYTSFDETVYMLQVASDRAGLVDKALLALADFGGGITLDPVEIDKERGVVIEEWRLRQGAGARLLEKQAPVLYYHSRYADRIPIGTPEILRTFTPARLRDFYNTWYRPDRMAVAVVGDVDPKVLVASIELTFGKLAPRHAEAAAPDQTLPPHDDTLVSVAADPEAQASSVTVLRIGPKPSEDRVGDYRRDLVKRLMFQMLNLRFAEIARASDAPFLAAGAGDEDLTAKNTAVALGARVEDGGAEKGLTSVLLEARRAREFGFTPAELDQARRRVLAAYEQAAAERDKTDSDSYADEYVRNFLTGEPIPGIQTEYDLTKGLLPGITNEEVSLSARDLLGEDNRVVLVTSPEKASVKLPDEAEIRKTLVDAAASTLTPWNQTTTRTELVPEKPAPGRVMSRRQIDALGVTVLSLSNGVEVWLKPTDFKNDQVLIGAYARGGASTAPEAQYLDAVLSASLVNVAGVGSMTPPQLAGLLAGRVANQTPYVDRSIHGLRGACRPQDLETALQLAYLDFTAPNFDQASFSLMERQLSALVANREQNPGAVFSDRLRALNTGDNYTVKPFTAASIAALKLDTMREAYRSRFANAADFTFFVVGSFDPATAVPLIERYVASLPSSLTATSHERPVGFRFPDSVERIRVNRGREPKSETVVTFFADAGADAQQKLMVEAAADVLEIRLRDLLREALGSTYSVSASYSDVLPETGYGTVAIQFGSAPDRAEALTADVLNEVEKLRASGPTEQECAKVREQNRRDLETASRQNGYWLSSLQTARILGRDPRTINDRRKHIDDLTPDGLHDAFRRYFPATRYTVATLMPAGDGGGDTSQPPSAPSQP
jgi:zinc protease